MTVGAGRAREEAARVDQATTGAQLLAAHADHPVQGQTAGV